MSSFNYPTGAGLGLRRELWNDLLYCSSESPVKFLEVAPENWIHRGGHSLEMFNQFASRFPIVAHGLSLSLGGSTPLNKAFLADIREFLNHYRIAIYSEHLAYCANHTGYWYDLLPVPMTEPIAHYIADRIKEVQDFLGREIAIENTSSYIIPDGTTIPEWEFISTIAERADCAIHLDVNNVYVNSVNHIFDPYVYLKTLDTNRIRYMHIAGHLEDYAPDTETRLLIDTHGAPVCESVWALYSFAVQRFGCIPTLLERDLNVPDYAELENEVARITTIQEAYATSMARNAA